MRKYPTRAYVNDLAEVASLIATTKGDESTQIAQPRKSWYNSTTVCSTVAVLAINQQTLIAGQEQINKRSLGWHLETVHRDS